MGLVRSAGGALFSKFAVLPQGPTAELVHQALHHAIAGVGPLHGARQAAEQALASADGDVDGAIDRLLRVHLALAGSQGFLTNLGGLVTAAWSIPANISGLALVQVRLVAAIAHLRGYDLSDTRVRNAVLATLLGRRTVRELVGAGKLPGTPRQIAELPTGEHTRAPDEGGRISRAARTPLDRTVGAQVATTLLAEVGGKRVASFVGRRIPVLGGVIGASSDAWNTRALAAYAREELAGPSAGSASGSAA